MNAAKLLEQRHSEMWDRLVDVLQREEIDIFHPAVLAYADCVAMIENRPMAEVLDVALDVVDPEEVELESEVVPISDIPLTEEP